MMNRVKKKKKKVEGRRRRRRKKAMGLGRLMVSLKSKMRCLKIVKKSEYDKVEKSESMRMEIRSRKARKLIEQTLKVADSPKSKTFAF
ncbi:hypothetical protein LR48_Vigan10g222900 [Vigna angularis]|uniref:Uncharacterized protein n=1 Tax=Phaseolus angularis TaxID=3914 RepID=A0A0L9VN52_PHAAN|nr:hypothetical protein LR48_Vigan10g222900 [Vigna angularis]